MCEKTPADALKDELFYSPEHAAFTCEDGEIETADSFCGDYIDFLNRCKTEREVAAYVKTLAEENGFIPFDPDGSYEPGDKVYYDNKGKALILCVFGKQSLKSGAKIVASHIDSPRLDLKPNPLYEDTDLALFKTHYYGGIKKYQWTAIPLELHGTVALKDGTTVPVVIGRDKNDPQLVITDLLPHLAADQMKKTMAEGISGEALNILIGSAPYADEGKDRVKLAVMSILNENYGITEADFISAELCAVPAFEVRDVGLDRSLIGAYGHDDRVCAYAELRALLDVKKPERTCICILADKEETGSDGVSGMKSEAFEWFVGDLCKGQSVCLRDCFAKSFCLSADVTAAFDPNYPEVSEKRNDAKINYGIGLCKYTGARGKAGTSDASAEVVAYVRSIFDRDGVVWQMCELGKVDQGGGGTVAMYMANRNIDTLDAGVPVLSMHAPFEIVSKYDCYMTYKGVLSAYRG